MLFAASTGSPAQAMGRTRCEAQQHNTAQFRSHRSVLWLPARSRRVCGRESVSSLAPPRLPRAERGGREVQNKGHGAWVSRAFLGLLLKMKRSVCSYQFNIYMWTMCPV